MGWKATVHAQDSLVNDCGERYIVEHVYENTPQGYIIPSLTLIIKTIYSVYWFTFMISSEHKHFIRVTYLICKQQTYSLYTLISSINIITYYNPFILRGSTSYCLHDSNKVIELSVKVTCDEDGTFYLNQWTFLIAENHFGLIDEPTNLFLSQINQGANF